MTWPNKPQKCTVGRKAEEAPVMKEKVSAGRCSLLAEFCYFIACRRAYIKFRIAMAEAAFYKKKALFSSKFDFNLRKKLINCYV